MEEPRPIACTLTEADLRDRRQAWLKVGNYAKGSGKVPGGMAFTFVPGPGVDDSLRELVRLEAECCPWMDFRLQNTSSEVSLTVTATDADGERGVGEAFAPLTAVAHHRGDSGMATGRGRR
jgi:hypothetical protein